MWEKRIIHKGLNAYRLVRGYSQHEVETKAGLQLAQWEARWKAQQQRSDRQLRITNDQAAKNSALEQTVELEAQRKILETLLTSICSTDASLDWEALKQHAKFSLPVPIKPTLQPLPTSPSPLQPAKPLPALIVHTARDATPQWSVAERAMPFLRKKKQLEAEVLAKRYAFDAELLNSNEVAKRNALIEARRKEEDTHKEAEARHRALCEQTKQMNEARQSEYLANVAAWHELKIAFEAQQHAGNIQIDLFKERFLASNPTAIKDYFYEVLARSPYPDSFPREHFLDITSERTLILDFELPSLTALPKVKEVKYVVARATFQEVPLSDVWTRKVFDEVLYQICLRTMYELFRADSLDVLRSVVFNGWVRAIDRSTGTEVHSCVMSLEAGKDEFLAINLMHVEPKACFKKLKGVSASKLAELSPVKPLVQLNKDDKRFVEGYAVVDSLDDRTNLAAMDWLDFENLIRELFEKEFSKGGGEVKITQASRDGGVDAIAFDPDPIRGGKLVIQAKRYTNTVGVSAVRDLYGTVHNEGANKGILVTTSDFGPDAYAFAKDKPLTLLSGGELLYLLAQHGHAAKIDIAEAKRLAAENA